MPFITDFGQTLTARQNGVVVMTIPRYGYWKMVGTKNQCVDTSESLHSLQVKYGPGLKVVALYIRENLHSK